MDINTDDCLALALALSFRKKKKKRKRVWVKNWLSRRDEFTHDNLLQELRMNEPADYRNFLRMDANSFDEILSMVAPIIEKMKTVMRKPLSASQRLSITLRYLATGNTFEDLKFISAVSPQAIGEIVKETCAAIIYSLRNYIQLPKTEDEWIRVAKEFEQQWNFPHCLGAVDGKHVNIKKPAGSG